MKKVICLGILLFLLTGCSDNQYYVKEKDFIDEIEICNETFYLNEYLSTDEEGEITGRLYLKELLNSIKSSCEN